MQDFRYEIKFVLNEQSFTHFNHWLHFDTHCRKKFNDRIVNSIYFDDVNFSSVKDNLSGVSNRIKTRIRWYSSPEDYLPSKLILETKIKSGRLGTKKTLPLQDFHFNPEQTSFLELSNFLKYKSSLENPFTSSHLLPTLYVSYSRKYFESKEGLRITIDRGIKFKGNFSFEDPVNKKGHICYNSIVVELKFDPSIKGHVNNLLRTINLTPTRHSKYLTGLAMLGQVQYV